MIDHCQLMEKKRKFQQIFCFICIEFAFIQDLIDQVTWIRKIISSGKNGNYEILLKWVIPFDQNICKKMKRTFVFYMVHVHSPYLFIIISDWFNRTMSIELFLYTVYVLAGIWMLLKWSKLDKITFYCYWLWLVVCR